MIQTNKKLINDGIAIDEDCDTAYGPIFNAYATT
jgi:hypothetical protein